MTYVLNQYVICSKLSGPPEYYVKHISVIIRIFIQNVLQVWLHGWQSVSACVAQIRTTASSIIS